MKKIILTILIIIFFSPNASSDEIYFINFSKVLNQSNAGKKAQDYLKKKITSDNKKFKETEKKLRAKEKDLTGKKKLLSADEYKKEISLLRDQVAKLQKDKQKSLGDVAIMRAKAKKQLVEKLNPILKSYMEKNNIRLVLDKKEVVIGDSKLEITQQILDLLNKEVKSLNFK